MTMTITMTDNQKRLVKLYKLLLRQKVTHTNPVEIGIEDLEWLVFCATLLLSKYANTAPSSGDNLEIHE